MAAIIKEYKHPIFADGFQYEGVDDFPGSLTIPDHWIMDGSSFTTMSGILLEAIDEGMLIYNGTPIDHLRIHTTGNANYSLTWLFEGRENLKARFMGRYSTGDCVYFEVDFENNTATLSTCETDILIDTASHVFDFENHKLYEVSLWMYENTIQGYINGSLIVSGPCSLNVDKHAFGLWVPELFEGDPATFNRVVIRELTLYPSASLDENDLMVQFRTLMKKKVENPDEKTWETFKMARKLWESKRNLPRLDENWANLGYPIRKPSTEDWLV